MTTDLHPDDVEAAARSMCEARGIRWSRLTAFDRDNLMREVRAALIAADAERATRGLVLREIGIALVCAAVAWCQSERGYGPAYKSVSPDPEGDAIDGYWREADA